MKISKGNKIAVVWGAETQLGEKLIDQLLFHSAYVEVKVFVEKKLNIKGKKLKEYIYASDDFKMHQEDWTGSDLFLCKLVDSNQSISKKELYKKNFLLPAQIAKLCEKGKVNQVFCISTLGANENAPFFNHRLLGALEKHISKMDFWSVHFFQPTFLMKRESMSIAQKQLVKLLGGFFNNLSGGKLDGIKPVPIEVVAKAMVIAAQQLNKGIHFYKNSDFQKIEKMDE